MTCRRKPQTGPAPVEEYLNALSVDARTADMAAGAAENRSTELMQALGLAVAMGGTELDKIGAALGSTTAKRDYRRENAALKAALER